MNTDARAVLIPIAVLGLAIVGLGVAYWLESGVEPLVPPAQQEAACPACATEDGEDVPAPGLLGVRGRIPEFTFEDQDGHPFGSKDLLGHVWVADFIYLKCKGPCPAMTVDMKTLQDGTADMPELRLVTFTVDPAHDSVADLKQYAANTDADPSRWIFLRGPVDELKRVMIEGFKIGDKQNPLNHSTRFCLVDQTGRVRGHYDHRRGDEMVRLRKHVHLLLTGERL